MREPQAWASHYRPELNRALDEAGASNFFKVLVTETVPFRHSIVEELHKWHDDERSIDEAVETAQRLGGGFFQKCWNGEKADAFLHADDNNQRIIKQAYDISVIIRDADSDYTAKVVHERWTGD